MERPKSEMGLIIRVCSFLQPGNLARAKRHNLANQISLGVPENIDLRGKPSEAKNARGSARSDTTRQRRM